MASEIIYHIIYHITFLSLNVDVSQPGFGSFLCTLREREGQRVYGGEVMGKADRDTSVLDAHLQPGRMRYWRLLPLWRSGNVSA